MTGQCLHHLAGSHSLGNSRQHVQVAHGFLQPPAAAGQADLGDRFEFREILDDPVHGDPRCGQPGPRAALAGNRNPLENRLFRLRAEPLQFGNHALGSRRLQSVQRFQAQVLEQHAHLLGSQARDPQHRHHASGNLFTEFIELIQLAGLDDRGDLLGQVLADPRQFLGRPLGILNQQRDGLGERLDRPRSVAVGADPERVGPLDLQEVGQVNQHSRDVRVAHASPVTI